MFTNTILVCQAVIRDVVGEERQVSLSEKFFRISTDLENLILVNTLCLNILHGKRKKRREIDV
jgi:hypothetical protein